MKLREKFLNIIEQTKPHWYKVDAESCEKIADDFAIGFAEWYFIETFISENSVELTTKQLLEIYKKEKGL